MESYCTECGRIMSVGDTHRKCKMCRKREYAKEERVVHHFDANPQLDHDAAEAAAAGISYGRWRMLKEMRERGEI